MERSFDRTSETDQEILERCETMDACHPAVTDECNVLVVVEFSFSCSDIVAGCTVEELWQLLDKRCEDRVSSIRSCRPGIWRSVLNHHETGDLVSTDHLPSTWEEAVAEGVVLRASRSLQDAVMGIRAGRALLSSVQQRVLQFVARARWAGVPQAELAQRLGLQPRNFFPVAKGLEARGMIVRQGQLGSTSTPVVVYLPQFAPSVRPVCPESRTSADEDDAALRQVMSLLRESPGGIALEREIKVCLGIHQGTPSHRRWRRLRSRLLRSGLVTQVGVEQGKGAHACLKLEECTPESKHELNVQDIGKRELEQIAGTDDEEDTRIGERCLLAEAGPERQVVSALQASGTRGLTHVELFARLGLPVKRNMFVMEGLDKAGVLNSGLESNGKHARYRVNLQEKWKKTLILPHADGPVPPALKKRRVACSTSDAVPANTEVPVLTLPPAATAVEQLPCPQHTLWSHLGSVCARFRELIQAIDWVEGATPESLCDALMDLLPYHIKLPPVRATPTMRLRQGLLLARIRNHGFLGHIEAAKLVRAWEKSHATVDLKTARRMVNSLVESGMARCVTLSVNSSDLLQSQGQKVVRALVALETPDKDVPWEAILDRTRDIERRKDGGAPLPLLDVHENKHLIRMSCKASRVLFESHKNLLRSGFAWARAIRARELHLWLVGWVMSKGDGARFTISDLQSSMPLGLFCLSVGTRQPITELGDPSPVGLVPSSFWTAAAQKRFGVLVRLLHQLGLLTRSVQELEPKGQPQPGESTLESEVVYEDAFELSPCRDALERLRGAQQEEGRIQISSGVCATEAASLYWETLKKILLKKDDLTCDAKSVMAKVPDSLSNPANWSETRLIPFTTRIKLFRWLKDHIDWTVKEPGKPSEWNEFCDLGLSMGLSKEQIRIIVMDFASQQHEAFLSRMFPRQARRTLQVSIRGQLAASGRIGRLSTVRAASVPKGPKKITTNQKKPTKPVTKTKPRKASQATGATIAHPTIRRWSIEDDRKLLQAYTKFKARLLEGDSLDWRSIPNLPTRGSQCKRRIARFKTDRACTRMLNNSISDLRKNKFEAYAARLEELLLLTQKFRFTAMVPSRGIAIRDWNGLSEDPTMAFCTNILIGNLLRGHETTIAAAFSTDKHLKSISPAEQEEVITTLELFGVLREVPPGKPRSAKLSNNFKKLARHVTEDLEAWKVYPDVCFPETVSSKQEQYLAGHLALAVDVLSREGTCSIGKQKVAQVGEEMHPETRLTSRLEHAETTAELLECEKLFLSLDQSHKWIPCDPSQIDEFVACLYNSRLTDESVMNLNAIDVHRFSEILQGRLKPCGGMSIASFKALVEPVVKHPDILLEAMAMAGRIRLLDTFQGKRLFSYDEQSQKFVYKQEHEVGKVVTLLGNRFICNHYTEDVARPWRDSNGKPDKHITKRLLLSMLRSIDQNPGICRADLLEQYNTIGPQNANDLVMWLISEGMIEILHGTSEDTDMQGMVLPSLRYHLSLKSLVHIV